MLLAALKSILKERKDMKECCGTQHSPCVGCQVLIYMIFTTATFSKRMIMIDIRQVYDILVKRSEILKEIKCIYTLDDILLSQEEIIAPRQHSELSANRKPASCHGIVCTLHVSRWSYLRKQFIDINNGILHKLRSLDRKNSQDIWGGLHLHSVRLLTTRKTPGFSLSTPRDSTCCMMTH